MASPATSIPNGDDAAVAQVLLDSCSVESRSQLIERLLTSVDPEDQLSVDLVARLVIHERSRQSKNGLFSFLLHAIAAGNSATASSVCSRYPDVGTLVFTTIVDRLDPDDSVLGDDSIDHERLANDLRFCKSVIPRLPRVENPPAILLKALQFMGRGEKNEVCLVARDLVFKILSLSGENAIFKGAVRTANSHIWELIQQLARSEEDKIAATLGYSLWLRWLSSKPEDDQDSTPSQAYWDLILSGLRLGDHERRKICLMILRLTISRQNKMPKEQHLQYDRFCTVFETIVLGRYINQIHECESDLHFLASSESCLPTSWLFVLLGSAIDPQVQDSNRKFIGNWVMKSDISFGGELLEFLRDDFLPWAIQGQLFVSSLKRRDGVLRCLHGERLSAFIESVATERHASEEKLLSSNYDGLTRIVIDLLYEKRNSMFAYAMVYLVKGIDIHLESEQREKIAEYTMTRLPEVARDYIITKLYPGLPPDQAMRSSSRRQMLEKDAIEKCKTLPANLESLEDLWSDLDYLEFPKDVLMVAPSALFQIPMIKEATRNEDMATTLAEKLTILQKISETKTFLLVPLTQAIRRLWVSYPEVVNILDIHTFMIRIANRPPESTLDLQLEESTINMAGFSFRKYFGEEPSFGFGAYIDLVSRLGSNQDLVRAIFTSLLEPWNSQKAPPPTVSTWKTTLQLQVMLLCSEQLERNSGEAQEQLDDLFQIMAIEPLPRYRYLLEWMATRLCIQHGLQRNVLSHLSTKNHHSNPKFLASLMKVGCTLASAESSGQEFAVELAHAFVPLAASSKVVIRHEAQWQIPILMDLAQARRWRSVAESEALVSLDGYIRSLERFSDPPPERMVGTFAPTTDHNLTNLVEGRWFDLDGIEPRLTKRDDLVRLRRIDADSGTWPTQAPRSCLDLGPPLPHPHESTTPDPDPDPLPPTSKPPPAIGPKTLDHVTALQTKGAAAYLARTLTDTTTSTSTSTSTSTRPRNLIIVGSLVDNPHNLGGLSRVGEIFGAAALTLQNQNVLANRDFTSVSVSSHLHFPVVQLSAAAVPGFLAERKGEGYGVVGIEQTDRSIRLGAAEAVLPEKAVLVVGSEREGIPALVLTECDVLVEIPQEGITRSLNVQTAVAVVLYEYARQHQRK